MYEDELHDLMLAVEVPVSKADVHKAIVKGRRQARVRAALVSGATGVVVVAVVGAFVALRPQPETSEPQQGPPSHAAPVKGCVGTALALPKGTTEATVKAIDPTGEIVAGYIGTESPKPVVWKGEGAPELLPGVAGVAVAVATDGTVVGYDANQADESVGWVYRNGRATNLAKVNGYKWTNPNAINASGVIAGWVHGEALDDTAPVVWAADGTVHKLTVPQGVGHQDVHAATARDVADDGTVVGAVRDVPMLWKPDGTPQALPLPSGVDNGMAMAVAGSYAYGNTSDGPVRWDLRTGQVVKLPPNGDFGAWDGSANGFALLPGDRDKSALRVGLDGQTDSFTAPNNEKALPFAISADGATVAGVGAVGEDTAHPVVWHCN